MKINVVAIMAIVGVLCFGTIMNEPGPVQNVEGVDGGTAYYWTGNGDGSSWNDADNWEPSTGYPNYPEDIVTINNTSDTININEEVTIRCLYLIDSFDGQVIQQEDFIINHLESVNGTAPVLQVSAGTYDINNHDLTFLSPDAVINVTQNGTFRASYGGDIYFNGKLIGFDCTWRKIRLSLATIHIQANGKSIQEFYFGDSPNHFIGTIELDLRANGTYNFKEDFQCASFIANGSATDYTTLLNFTIGKLLYISNDITILGKPGNLIRINDNKFGCYSSIFLSGRVSQNIQYVNVRDNWALYSTVYAYNSIDGGNNVNWAFL